MKRVIRGSVTSSKITNSQSEYEYRKNIYLKRKQEFETLGEEGNNDVLSREEKMNIAKAEMDKVAPKSVKSAKDATFKNDKRLSPTSERYKGYLIVLDRGGDGYNVYDKHRELEDSGYPSREAAKKFIDELVANEEVYSSKSLHNQGDLIHKAIKGDQSAIKLLKSQGYKVNKLVNPLHRNEVGTYEVTDTDGCIYNYDNTIMRDIHSSTSDDEYDEFSFMVGDQLEWSGLYGGQYRAVVTSVSDEYITVDVMWTAEDTGDTVIDTKNFEIEVDPEGKECIIVYQYGDAVGYVYPPSGDNVNSAEAVDNGEREFQCIDRSGTDEEVKLAAVMYNLGTTMKEAREILTTLSEDKIQEYVDYYNLRDLPRSKRVEIWNNRNKVNASSNIPDHIKEVVSQYDDAYVFIEEDTIVIDCGSSKSLRAIASKLGITSDDIIDSPADHKAYIESYTEDVNSSSYGGAFDIEDDQYFTKDEIVEFGNTVCDHLNETFYDTYDVSDVYMETPKKLVLTIVQKSDESEFTATIDIDMRKIKKPADLMNRYLGDVVYALQQDIKAYNDEINASSDITSAQKTGVEWIKTKVWNAIVAKLEDDGWEPDDIADYVFVEVTQEDDRIRVEVRAELSYEGLEELIECIDPIVQEYDNNAYFEPVEPGIAEAYIWNLSKINSSETVEAGIYDVPDRPLDPPEDNSWEELDSDDEVIELTLDAIVHIDENGSWEYDDTNYPWAASPDNKKGDWYTDKYSVYIGDKTSIVEYVDELLEPMMPAKEGEYHIKGDVTLVFSVEGIEVKRDYFWDERHGADYDEEAYTDDAETSFLYDKSHIKNFEITER